LLKLLKVFVFATWLFLMYNADRHHSGWEEVNPLRGLGNMRKEPWNVFLAHGNPASLWQVPKDDVHHHLSFLPRGFSHSASSSRSQTCSPSHHQRHIIFKLNQASDSQGLLILYLSVALHVIHPHTSLLYFSHLSTHTPSTMRMKVPSTPKPSDNMKNSSSPRRLPLSRIKMVRTTGSRQSAANVPLLPPCNSSITGLRAQIQRIFDMNFLFDK